MGLFNRKNKEPDIQKLFQKNLKYISKTEVNVKDMENQFIKTQSRYYLTVGYVDCPTGKIIAADPLCYLYGGKLCPQLEIEVPSGSYPVEVSIFRNEHVGVRMCTSRLKIKDTKAIKYVSAKSTTETAVGLDGFPVEAGMMSFCDVQVANEYRLFIDNWYKENKDKNHYDDYFADFFAKSAELLPQYQRALGDFIEWSNPDSDNRLVMIASGFGDGFYQSYWGYDEDNEICELIVPMVNPNIFE